MSLNSINRCLTNNTLWVFFSFSILALYLSPLVMNDGVFYVPYFDNLDSNVVWYKILAESGMIFADNNAIIPNMMNGLPRASYPGEFDIILWLYYFFSPNTAYVINEIFIHTVAFFSMYIFLKKYIVKKKTYYQNVPIFVGALYFALIPYWSGAGLTIAILPLVTYSLLNIKNNISTKWDWILLILLPLYTSFVFLYMFYIIIAGIYMIWDTIKNRQLNRPFFLALFLMGTVFLLSNYRLILAMFIDSGFISHRTEFNIFFTYDFLDSLRRAHTFFLSGHTEHLPGLQLFYVIPIVLISIILNFSNRRFNTIESFLIWIIILLSFILDFWQYTLPMIYALPTIFITSLIILKKNKLLGYLLLFQLFLALFAGAIHYNVLNFIPELFPIFGKLNLTRFAFIQPFIWAILLVISTQVIIRKLHFSFIFIVIFMLIQVYTSIHYSYYQHQPISGYSSFKNYYAKKLFEKVKDTIHEPIDKIRVVSFGIEPAVSLYNGFYTVDGYSVNYPLKYKHKFRQVISETTKKDTYDNWGSKLYILGTNVTLNNYLRNVRVDRIAFNSKALCNLNTNYVISAYEFEKPKDNNLFFIRSFNGEEKSWNIYLYKLNCTLSQTK